MRELGQVPGRPDGTLAGDNRQQVAVEQLDQPGGQVHPDTRVPRRQRPGAQQQQRADGRVVQRIAGGRRVGDDDRALQLGQVPLRHPGVGERAEPGVDAVDRGVAADRGGDHLPAPLHGGGDAGGKLGVRLTVRDVHDVLEREAVAADDHCSHGDSLPSRDARCCSRARPARRRAMSHDGRPRRLGSTSGMTMAVVGGTGTLGRQVAAELRPAGPGQAAQPPRTGVPR